MKAKASGAAHAKALHAQLVDVADADYAAGAKAYLKTDFDVLGARLPDIRGIAAAWTKTNRTLGHDDLVAVLEALWDAPSIDSKLLCGILAEKNVRLLVADDLAMVERWLRSSYTWALIDQIAPRVAGAIVARDPKLRLKVLTAWSKSDDFWVRRAAILAQLVELRQGTADWALFSKLAQGMLEEREFFIRKAIGWALREAVKKTPERVVEFCKANKQEMSALTWKEAARTLPPNLLEGLT